MREALSQHPLSMAQNDVVPVEIRFLLLRLLVEISLRITWEYAIQKAGSIDPQKVRDALANLDMMTFYGEIRFDSTGANTYKPMATIQIQNGSLVTVYPSDVANAQLSYPTPPLS